MNALDQGPERAERERRGRGSENKQRGMGEREMRSDGCTEDALIFYHYSTVATTVQYCTLVLRSP